MRIFNLKTSSNILQFENITLYFVYTFVFEPNNWEEINNCFQEGIPEERLGWIPTKITECSFENQKFCWINPFSQETIVKGKNKHVFDFVLNGTDFNSKEIQINSKISSLLRIKKSGVGTITFEINYRKKNNELISFFDIDPFFRLTPRTWSNLIYDKISKGRLKDQPYLSTLSNLDFKQEKVSLFSLFFKILQGISRYKINPIDGFYAKNFDYKFPAYGIYDPNDFDIKIKKNLGVDKTLKDTIHPYLYFTGQIEKNLYKRNFLDNKIKIKKRSIGIRNRYLLKQIASILFRLYYFQNFRYLNTPFIKQEIDSNNKDYSLPSDSLSSKVYTQIFRMASLCFHFNDRSLIHSDLPFNVLNPTIIDIIENTRSKWASLFHSNLILDLIIYNLNDISNLARKDIEHNFRAMLTVEKLIALSLADPNILLYDGHVAFDAIKSMYDKMGISTLSKFIQEKNDLVRNLLEHANSLKYFDMLNQ